MEQTTGFFCSLGYVGPPSLSATIGVQYSTSGMSHHFETHGPHQSHYTPSAKLRHRADQENGVGDDLAVECHFGTNKDLGPLLLLTYFLSKRF